MTNTKTEELLKVFEAWRDEIDEDHVMDIFDLALAFYAGQAFGKGLWAANEIDSSGASERFDDMHTQALAFASLARKHEQNV